MTAAATARLILHRAAKASTLGDLVRVGDALGVDRNLPVKAYQEAVARRLLEMVMLAQSVPYQAGLYPRFLN